MNEANFVHTSRVLIVEGKYDAARLSHLTDAMILLTDGFAIYKDKSASSCSRRWRRRTASFCSPTRTRQGSASATTSPI